MSFVVWAALAVAGLVVGPIVAHLLRRGRAREREFPGAALVPPLTSTARQRSRLEDLPLLILRSAMICALAVLGATPLVRCQRLSLARESGASVAIALVLDDSLSMRAHTPGGTPRWDVARSGGLDLLRSARSGDSVAIVLAGKPARIALSPTTDIGAAIRALGEISVSDRSTDLASAVELARSALRALPQKDRRVVVLSDLAADAIPDGNPPVAVPLAALAEPAADCGITSADRHERRVTVSVACSSDGAARDRRVELVVSRTRSETTGDAGTTHAGVGDVVASVDLGPRRGEQTVAFDVGARAALLDARLTGADASSHDDEAPVSDDVGAPAIAVVADAASASAKTGGPTVIEQALTALGSGWILRPLPFVPDDEKGLDEFGALVVDDPKGFSPEARVTLRRFLEHGGVALALLGRRAAATELGFPLEPFARGAIRWETTSAAGIDPKSVAWLGPEAVSLEKIARGGRARLDGTEPEGARVVGRWDDGVPWLVERRAGRGLSLTAGLSASLDDSDLALRPGFLSLLDHVLSQADLRKGSRRTVAGVPWTFSDAKEVVIRGPEGDVAVARESGDENCVEPNADCGRPVLRALPTVRGRYEVRVDGEPEQRIVTLEPAEILTEPRAQRASAAEASKAALAPVDASREIALTLIALFGAEVAIRVLRRRAARPVHLASA